MNIGIIGTGSMGKPLARQFAAVGFDVIVSNSRGPETLATFAREAGVTAGTKYDAAKQDIVILAVRWEHVENVLADLDLSNKILIDVTNQMEGAAPRGSLKIAQLAPGARIVKAFNTLYAQYLDGTTASGKRYLAYAGDDVDAKKIMADIFDKLGYDARDAGDLSAGNRAMEFGALLSARHFSLPTDRQFGRVLVTPKAGGPDNFDFNFEEITAPQADEVQIKQLAIAVTKADTYVRRGKSIPLPAVIGEAAAGIVTAVGTNVTSINVGDRVVYHNQIGAYRESRNLDAALVDLIPADVSFAEAATGQSAPIASYQFEDVRHVHQLLDARQIQEPVILKF